MGRFAFMLLPRDALYVVKHLRAYDRTEAYALSGQTSDDEIAHKLVSAPGLAYTVWAPDTEPVAIGGWAPLWPGVASAWMLATDRIKDVGVAIDRAIIAGHRRMFEDGYHRLQAFGLAARDDNRSWLINLGYIPEGTHPGFGRHGETFVSYAKLKKGAA